MTEKTADSIVCDCAGVRRHKILQLIAQGVTTLERIEDITGANTGCGSCDAEIQAMLDEQLTKESSQ